MKSKYMRLKRCNEAYVIGLITERLCINVTRTIDVRSALL